MRNEIGSSRYSEKSFVKFISLDLESIRDIEMGVMKKEEENKREAFHVKANEILNELDLSKFLDELEYLINFSGEAMQI